LSLTPNLVGNHPVIKSKIGGTTLGETECDFKVSCSCTRSFKWIGGCILGILWPDGYSCELEYSLKTTITLDYDKHGGTGPYLSGTYGHELIHAMNCRRKARQLYATGKKSGHFDSTFACIENAVEIESDINTWNYQEHLHMNPDSPLPGFPYPIDPDLVDPIWTPENPPCPITLPHPWPGR